MEPGTQSEAAKTTTAEVVAGEKSQAKEGLSKEPTASSASSSPSSVPPPPPQSKAGAGTWLLAHDASGRAYYYNSRTQESRWDRPDELDSAPGDDAGNAANPLGQAAGHALAAGRFHASAAYESSNKRAHTEVEQDPGADKLNAVLGRIDPAASGNTWTPHALIQKQNKEQGPGYKDYSVNATFNRSTGRFDYAGDESYFDRNNIPADREGRQMSNFFDLDNLQANREEYKRLKKQRLNTKGIDWRKYKEKSKKKKAKKRNAWLFED